MDGRADATLPGLSTSGARALLRERDFMVYMTSRGCGVLGTVAQSVTMGWQVYDLNRAEKGVAESAFFVGLLGLATFLPLFFLALPAGVVADRSSRRAVLIACFAGEALCAGALLLASALGALHPVLADSAARRQRACHHPAAHFGCAGLLQRRRQFVEAGAGGHHVVDQRNALALNFFRTSERAAHVTSPCVVFQPHLRRGVAGTSTTV
jgi:hypothetical protein